MPFGPFSWVFFGASVGADNGVVGAEGTLDTVADDSSRVSAWFVETKEAGGVSVIAVGPISFCGNGEGKKGETVCIDVFDRAAAELAGSLT